MGSKNNTNWLSTVQERLKSQLLKSEPSSNSWPTGGNVCYLTFLLNGNDVQLFKAVRDWIKWDNI